MSTLTEQAGEPRTTILTVDDDPGVSRAVARDLRRRYGERYRIVRAESASAGLDALRQIKLRGDLVAVILADYRMPEMNGLEVRGSARRVTFADGTFIDAHTVILATGVSDRRLDVPGLGQLTGRGVYYGSALTEASACAGQDVYVVGGANSAGQAALYLARYATSVTLLVRGPSPVREMERMND
jgi:CheY-like chemotaxis protein